MIQLLPYVAIKIINAEFAYGIQNLQLCNLKHFFMNMPFELLYWFKCILPPMIFRFGVHLNQSLLKMHLSCMMMFNTSINTLLSKFILRYQTNRVACRVEDCEIHNLMHIQINLNYVIQRVFSIKSNVI